ncbi:hypothetical protein FISHEDRAFT_73859 [Fistulina hepatica ATCC 64428]|uniref:Uncharacterized protein n=1 Tax=Fistulina hepatica ATCC 64428 TaxID=1128425 RepID=A0A0D7AEK1_9AGAR|nr:hypothetical protein FISHEDRAFT_73859 [Fistulina hepatica ATCC 64428]
MRRAQTLRHNGRPSLALTSDDLGVLREGDETDEDVLRRQLLERDRDNDKLQTQILALQAQLAQRPSTEAVQDLQREYKNLELILEGTQRENERCMNENERIKTREKMLERELVKLAGENWQSTLDIAPSNASTTSSSFSAVAPRTASTLRRVVNTQPTSASPVSLSEQDAETTLAHIEQVRMLILGMEKRLQTREEKLVEIIAKAEAASGKYGELSQAAAV